MIVKPLAGLTRRNLGREILSGITLLALAVPLNIGYAQIAGLDPAAGLYALIVPSVVYVLLVSSRQVVASPDAAAAALVFSSLTSLGIGGEDFAAAAAAQAILCGAFLLIASVFRWGFLANFLSQPILVGFVAGLAIEVLLSQVRKMLAVPRGDSEGFFVEAWHLLTHLALASPAAVAMSVGALAVMVLLRRFAPAVPAALVVLVVATVVTVVASLSDYGVSVIGSVDGGMPAFGFPMLSVAQWVALVPSALALALVTMSEGLLVSRSYGKRRGYDTEPDQDLAAFGAANIASGLSGSFSVGSSTSRTAAMDEAGSRTQLPTLVAAVGALLLLLFGTDLLASIPEPAIGAVVAIAVVGLLGIGEFRAIWSSSRHEFAIAVACFLGVVVLGPIPGILVAFVLSLVNLARRAATPVVEVEHPVSATDVVEVSFAGAIFFANAAAFSREVAAARADPPRDAVVIDASGISDIDVTAAEEVRAMLEGLTADGVRVALCRLHPAVAARFEQFGLLALVPRFATKDEAVAAVTMPRRDGSA